MDTESVRRFWDYTKAYQAMFEATDTPASTWYLVPADDKRRARLNLISHMLSQIPYKRVKQDLPKVPAPKSSPDSSPGKLRTAHSVPARY